jgi:hypothetical protein
LIENLESIIESVKSEINQRAYPLTLELIGDINIQTAVRAMKRLEEESDVTKRLKV